MDETGILIIGANGQLGRALQAQYPEAKAVDIDKLNIADHTSVVNFDWSKISTVINAAAYTNVDGAETSEGRVAAWKVNALAVQNLAEQAIKHNCTFVHVSSDYVFDGSVNPHTEDEPFSPLSVYGSSKAAGDLIVGTVPKHYILRTTWLIGEGKNFVRTMLDLGAKGISPTVVSDQIGRLTFTAELVRAIHHLLEQSAPYGTYNITGEGESVSWADITRVIFKEAGYTSSVSDISTEDYYKGKENIAPRPLLSIMSLDKLKNIGFSPRNWTEDLHDYISTELKKES